MAKKGSLPLIYMIGMALVVIGFICPVFDFVIKENGFDFMQIWFKDGQIVLDNIPEPKIEYIKKIGFPVIFHAVFTPADIDDNIGPIVDSAFVTFANLDSPNPVQLAASNIPFVKGLSSASSYA